MPLPFKKTGRDPGDADRPMPTLKALIFDVDGTLADTEETHRLAFNETFAKYGLDWYWSPEQYIRLLAISGGRERIRRYARTHPRPGYAHLSDEDLAGELHHDKTERYARMLVEGHVGLRPGVLRLLREARCDGIRLAIATSTARSNVITLLDNNLPEGWQAWFEVIVSSEDISRQKPDPEVYQRALAGIGVMADDAMAIEDTENGHRAARAAGLKTVITTHYFTEHHDFSGASLVVNRLGEPDLPFKRAAGDAHGATLVDIALLRRLNAPAGIPVSEQDCAMLLEGSCG